MLRGRSFLVVTTILIGLSLALAPTPGSAGMEPDLVRKALNSPDSAERIEAIRQIFPGALPDEEAVALLRRALADEAPSVQAEAVERLAEFGIDVRPPAKGSAPSFNADQRTYAADADADAEPRAPIDDSAGDQSADSDEMAAEPWAPWLLYAAGGLALIVLFYALARRRFGAGTGRPGARPAPTARDADARSGSFVLAGRFATDKPLESGERDLLGFGTVARTVSMFLRHERTRPPLTLAINGEWGSGKSSLMNLLAADLRNHGWRPVWFNAWHHQKDDHLLAALIEAVRRQAVPPFWLPSGVWVRGKLLVIRLARKGTLLLALALLAAALLIAAALHVGARHAMAGFSPLTVATASAQHVYAALKAVTPESAMTATCHLHNALAEAGLTQRRRCASAVEDRNGAGGAAAQETTEDLDAAVPLTLLGVLLVLWLARNKLTSGVLSPGKLLALVSRRPAVGQLEAQLAFRGRFAAEFRDIARALSRPRFFSAPLILFIDDLDRCRAATVLEMLEAVNYLVSAGDCHVVIGMARNRVEAAVGLGLAAEADEMAAGGRPSGQEEAHAARRRYARDYLDKLINIEIPVPGLDESLRLQLLLDPGVPGAPGLRRFARWLHVHGLRAALAGMVFALAALLWLPPPGEPAGGASFPTTPVAAGRGPTAVTGVDPASAPSGDPSVEDGGAAGWPTWPALGAAGLVLPLLLLLEARRRVRADTVHDTDRFKDLVRRWQRVITTRRNTPRSIKRFVNRMRYLSLRLRAAEFDEGWLARWLEVRFIKEDERPPVTCRCGLDERLLVALGAIGHSDPLWLQNAALFDVDGWRRLRAPAEIHRHLGAQPPADADDEEVRAIADALADHLRDGGTWPPTAEQCAAYRDIAGGIRFFDEAPATTPASATSAPSPDLVQPRAA